MADRRHLVLVRAGPQSLHRSWLPVDVSQRNFDLVVSAYGGLTREAAGDVDAYTYRDGGKWDSLAAYLRDRPDLLERYDFVWLPDDDIEADASRIERMFALARAYRLDISQPALTLDSYFSYVETLAVDGYALRYANFIEIMMPCFAANALKEVAPFFDGTMSGFGLDMVWARRRPARDFAYAILDECPMRHTRPVGSVLRKVVDAAGRDQWAERVSTRRQGPFSALPSWISAPVQIATTPSPIILASAVASRSRSTARTLRR